MQVSVELSLYPLQDNYKPIVLAFLEDLAATAENVEIRTSNMSTRLFGEYAAVTDLLNQTMLRSMQKFGKVVFVAKYIQGDARELKNYN